MLLTLQGFYFNKTFLPNFKAVAGTVFPFW